MPKLCGDSADKPRVLLLCPELPWPAHSGGAMRTASLLAYFGPRATVDVIVFRERGESDTLSPDAPVSNLRFIDLPPHSRDPLSRMLRNTRRWIQQRPPLIDRFSGFDAALSDLLSGQHYQLAVVEHFWCAPYVDVLRSACDEVWLDLHNLESEWHETISQHSSPIARPAFATFAAACRRLERELLPRFDLVLVPSEHEAAAAQKITAHLHTAVYPNALQFIESPVCKEEEETIVFSGNLAYQPNIDAVRFFRRSVWPLLRERHAGLRWRILGKNEQGVARLVRGDERIELTGAVSDAITELARARVSVVPVRAGSGTRLKILEAWAAGTPVVSTSFGAQGLNAAAGQDILIADEPRDFAAGVSGLLGSPELRRSVSAAARRAYEKRYTWEAAWRVLASHSAAGVSSLRSLYTG